MKKENIKSINLLRYEVAKMEFATFVVEANTRVVMSISMMISIQLIDETILLIIEKRNIEYDCFLLLGDSTVLVDVDGTFKVIDSPLLNYSKKQFNTTKPEQNKIDTEEDF